VDSSRVTPTAVNPIPESLPIADIHSPRIFDYPVGQLPGSILASKTQITATACARYEFDPYEGTVFDKIVESNSRNGLPGKFKNPGSYRYR